MIVVGSQKRKRCDRLVGLSSRCDAFLITVLFVAAAIRTVAVATRDLPTGDEVNCYISDAQAFAAHGTMAPLSNHPGVSMIYGTLIVAIRTMYSTLDGVVAANAVFWISGVLAPCFMYLALKRWLGCLPAFLAGISLATFPGCYYVFRGDLSLYALWLSAMLFCLSRLPARQAWWWAAAAGGCGGCFYLCRSDGVYVVLLTLGAVAVVPRSLWRQVLLSLAIAVLVVGAFFGIRHRVMGSFGTGTSTRAIDAFYQAEGLHDGRGGSWQDFSERGLKRFGPPERYGGSVLGVMLANPGAVAGRVRNNGALLGSHLKKAIGTAAPWFVMLCLGSLLNARAAKAVLVMAVPCLAASTIYLAFYYQESYFVIQSFGLAVAGAVGLGAFLTFLAERLRWTKHLGRVTVAVGLILAIALAQRTVMRFPGVKAATVSSRCWNALVFLKRHAVEKGTTFFAYSYEGSRSMYIYTGGGEPDVADSDVQGKPAADIAALLRGRHIKYVLALKEQQDLWALSDVAPTAYANNRDDVRIYRVLE